MVQRLLDGSKWRYLASGLSKRMGQTRQCPACGSTAGGVCDRKFFHAFFHCPGCGLRYRFPFESAREMETFYQDDYESFGLTTDLPSDEALRHLMATGFSGSGKDFSYHIEIFRALGLTAGARIVDFGANWGYATWQFRQAGFLADAYELSRPRAAFGKKLGIDIVSDLSQLKPPYDAVYSCHVLEHTPDPRRALLEQMELVRPGGLVIAHTPNGSQSHQSKDSRGYRRIWGQVHPVLLTDEFVTGLFPGNPILVTSDDRPEQVRTWNRSSRQVEDCSRGELFFAVGKK